MTTMVSFLILLSLAAVATAVALICRIWAGLNYPTFAAHAMLDTIALERAETQKRQPGPEGRRHTLSPSPLSVLIVGAGAVGHRLAERLEACGRYRIVGFVDDCLERTVREDWPILGRRDDLVALVQDHGIDEIFLAYVPTWQQTLTEELMTNHLEVEVHVVPSPYEALLRTAHVENLGDLALVRVITDAGRRLDAAKRLFDIFASTVGLLMLGVPMAVIAIFIRLTSAGPVIFAQERIGQFGKPFVLYKFRTMVADAEARTGPVLSSGDDDGRLTWLGKWMRLFRIDELPQLWNVLRGEMSIVGPRPERPFFVEQFACRIPAYMQRHQVRPGITGLAQVCGGYHTDARDKLRFDLLYISHRSLWMDLTILLRTVLVVVFPHR